MFETLTDRLQSVFKTLGRRGTLREQDVEYALREIRLALLEADVNFNVVKDLLAVVREQTVGHKIAPGLNPAQHVVKVLNQALVQVLGEPERLILKGPSPRVIMLVGLQGSGKTTTAAKLGKWLKTQGERVWLVAADLQRPAAVRQLEILGQEESLTVFTDLEGEPVTVARDGVKAAGKAGASVAIIDTAGRSQLDQVMMEELTAINQAVQPVEMLLVADAMTGQEAVQIAQGFQSPLPLTGLILTKMDGDARGGAAISMRAVTGVPIKFIGTGEARDALATFEPDRMASRILGMGDVLTLIEQAEARLDQERVEKQAMRMLEGEFTLEDFAHQIGMMRKMGPMQKVMDMLPAGLGGGLMDQVDSEQVEQQLTRTQAIIDSMTHHERRHPDVLNASRKRRVAAGSGTTVQEINQLIKQYRQMRRLFKKMGNQGLPRNLGQLLG
ncbi:MAG: signal recognition particle protein [Anaerolineales bacterium]